MMFPSLSLLISILDSCPGQKENICQGRGIENGFYEKYEKKRGNLFFGIKVPKTNKKRHQISTQRTEAIFCSILIIECALESSDPVEFNQINLIFRACILHAELPKYWGGGRDFDPTLCLMSAHKMRLILLNSTEFHSFLTHIRIIKNRIKNKIASVRFF